LGSSLVNGTFTFPDTTTKKTSTSTIHRTTTHVGSRTTKKAVTPSKVTEKSQNFKVAFSVFWNNFNILQIFNLIISKAMSKTTAYSQRTSRSIQTTEHLDARIQTGVKDSDNSEKSEKVLNNNNDHYESGLNTNKWIVETTEETPRVRFGFPRFTTGRGMKFPSKRRENEIITEMTTQKKENFIFIG
jgi:hypothetical protein